MKEEFVNKRNMISVVLIMVAVGVIVIMAIVILGNSSKAKNEVNTVVGSNDTITEETNLSETGKNLNYITIEGVQINVSEQIKREHRVRYLIISNTKIVYENGISKLTADVLNISKATNDLKCRVTFLSNEAGLIAEKEFELGNINEDETKNISVEIQEDVSNAYLIRFELVN